MLLKKILGLMLFLSAFSSVADTQPPVTTTAYTNVQIVSNSSLHSSISAALHSLNAGYSQCSGVIWFSENSVSYEFYVPFIGGGYPSCLPSSQRAKMRVYKSGVNVGCPSGSTVNTAGSCTLSTPSCSVGYTYQSSDNLCHQDVPVCTPPQYLNTSTNICEGPTLCSSSQNPLTSNCKYPIDKGTAINCADGSSVYVPEVCPVTGSRWQDVFVPPKPLCSPLDIDHSNCEPLLFQRFDDFASSRAIAFATAILSLNPIPALSAEIATVVAGASVEARVLWDGVFHNSAGEIVDVKVEGKVPTSVVGDALAEFIKRNPTNPYVSEFPTRYNAQAPQAPIVVEPNTGVIHPADSNVPLSSNQLIKAAHSISPALNIPYDQIAPYITPERIPWIAEAAPSINYDLAHQSAPSNYPALNRTPNQVSAPSYQVSPNPYQIPAPFPAATPSSITGIVPFASLTPASPVPVAAPAPVASQLPNPTQNQNPLGTDSPTAPYTPPTEPIDPNAVEAPPVIPPIFTDTYKYFDFINPGPNPFVFDPQNFLPDLPTASCTYEIHRSFHVPILGTKYLDIAPCVPLQPLRAVLQWVFAVMTIFVCFFVVFRSSF